MPRFPGFPARRFAAALLLAVLLGAARGVLAEEGSRFGTDIHMVGPWDVPFVLDSSAAAGLGWVRIDFGWSDVEPSRGVYDWSGMDALVYGAALRGLSIYASIGWTPGWATDGPPGTGVPRNTADWTDFCSRAAARYAGVVGTWGIWNEPNLAMFWSGTRQQFIDTILVPGADALHAANPSARVAGPELAHLVGNGALWYRWLDDVLTQAGSHLDIVSHHVYDNSGYAAVTQKLDATTPFGTNPSLWDWVNPSVREVLVHAGWFGKPFWLTETGWASNIVGESAEASNYTGLLGDWFRGAPGRTWVNKVLFYDLQDDPDPAVDAYGILRRDGSRKPAFDALHAFVVSLSPPVATRLQPLAPCRLLDTREASGPTGGAPLAAYTRTLLPAVPACGVPADARAISANVTAVAPAGGGTVAVTAVEAMAPPGTVPFRAGQTRANNAIVALSRDGSGRLAATNDSGGTVHLVVDVNGYYR